MPWRECHKMDERLRFVARLLEGEKMAELCREFDISRKTGYKVFRRYKDLGLEGLTDRSRRPFRQANKLPMQIETLIVQLKREHPSGVRQKSARSSGASTTTSTPRPSAPCTPCSTATAWSPAGVVTALERRARRSPSPSSPMTSGAPTTRASSCSPITATAIR